MSQLKQLLPTPNGDIKRGNWACLKLNGPVKTFIIRQKGEKVMSASLIKALKTLISVLIKFCYHLIFNMFSKSNRNEKLSFKSDLC